MSGVSRIPARVSGWLSTSVFSILSVLSVLALELDNRSVVDTLEETVIALDDLARAKLAVAEAVLAWEGALTSDPSWPPGTDVARLDEAVGALEDLLAGRSALVRFRRNPLVDDPAVDSVAERYRALPVEARATAVGSGGSDDAVSWRQRIAALAGAATDLEREVHRIVQEQLARQRREHRMLLAAWSTFLAITGLGLVGLRTARRRAERRRATAERRYEALEALAAVGIVRVDGVGRVREATPWWDHFLGRQEGRCVGAEWWEFLPEEDRVPVRERWRSRTSERGEFAQEIRIADAAARRRWLQGRWSPSSGDEAEDDGWVGAFVDVTEQRSIEAQLHQSQKLEAIGRLTGSVVHDFNNLLSVILTNTHLLLTDPGALDEEQREMLEDVERAAGSGRDLVRRLMGFSRRAELNLLPVDLASVVRETAPFALKLVPTNVELDLRLPEPGPTVRADPRAVEQILLNLVSNARDALPEGGRIHIEVDALVSDAAFAGDRPWIERGRYGRITVSDTGVGMDEATMARIFDPFFTTKREGKGTGLGLSTVHGLMRQHGGSVRVYSEPGTGSTFRLYFPAVATEEEPVTADLVAVREATERAEPLSILVVEDDDALRQTTSRVLARVGHRVLEVASGEEALRFLTMHGGSVDLVLCDVTMKTMDGVELYRRLREAGDDRPFIFTSGRPESDVRASQSLPEGAVFLPKPWTVERLSEAIEKAGLRVD